MGHDALDAFRPEVAPCFGEYDRDSAQLMQRGVTHKHPILLASAIGLIGGATTRERLGQVVDQIAQIRAIGACAGARQGEYVRPP